LEHPVDIQFEWDEVKAISNEEKHGVAFSEATTIFTDPFLITFLDEEHSDYEDRFISIGLSERQGLLLVVHTDRDTAIRIISARQVTRREQRIYEQGSE
jgi:hypothetical protein